MDHAPGPPGRAGSRVRVPVVEVSANGRSGHIDEVATEEPMEIRVAAGGATRTVAITMRTPGADFELAAGFLFAEGVIKDAHDLRTIAYCTDPGLDEEQRYNVVTVDLRSPELPPLDSLDRHFYTSSACGVCGKASLDALKLRSERLTSGPRVPSTVVTSLPDKLRAAQPLFDRTGGLHAAALFDEEGTLLALREDVGRHNAMDKLVGWALLSDRLPLATDVVMVSGRTSFEIVQKALMARVAIVCSVSAPSSLAVSTAQEFGMTLVGFLRGSRFNVYAGAERLAEEATV